MGWPAAISDGLHYPQCLTLVGVTVVTPSALHAPAKGFIDRQTLTVKLLAVTFGKLLKEFGARVGKDCRPGGIPPCRRTSLPQTAVLARNTGRNTDDTPPHYR
jgi:hypothetical protein